MRYIVDENKLRFLYKKNKITQDVLARDMGITRQTLRRWCVFPTKLSNIMLVADYFKVSKSEIILIDDSNK